MRLPMQGLILLDAKVATLLLSLIAPLSLSLTVCSFLAGVLIKIQCPVVFILLWDIMQI